MTDTNDAGAAAGGSAAADAIAASKGGDERLAYRGVFQRLLIQPEIGAMIGAVAIWVFFWAASTQFGTASGAQNILDTAATLGIMAVAVSMLMIGGEFDLSSGANTGAMAMLTIYLVKPTGDLGGLGIPIPIALVISLLVALGIGWVNGFMVDRTALPSFIITLATFFVLKGLKLGLSKLLVEKIEMGRMEEGVGFESIPGLRAADLKKLFAGEWNRLDHVWEPRDLFYTVFGLVGVGLIVVAFYELNFAHRNRERWTPPLAALPGVAGIVVGVLILHWTDSIPMNWVGALVIWAGTIAAAIGLGVGRYENVSNRGGLQLTPAVLKPMGIGLACLVLGFLAAILIDSNDSENFIFPFTVQGIRATLFGGFVGFGFLNLFIASSRAKRVNMTTKFVASMVTAGMVVALAFVIQLESKSYKFRAEAFTVVLVIAMLIATWALAGLIYRERYRTNPAADPAGMRIGAIGVILFVLAMVIKLLFAVQAEIDAGITPAKFSMRIAWFVGFTAIMAWVLARTRFGSWTFAVGGNAKAARETGVPAARTKTRLFMLVSFAAWLVGVLVAFRINSVQANQGDGAEFNYIIAAVVGGTLLTGGYGTAIGGAIGALVMAMATLGIPFAQWNSDWAFLFLGVILLLAAISNKFIRAKAEALAS